MKPKFKIIKKEEKLKLEIRTNWETWFCDIGFEVNDPNNMRNSIKFDKVILDKIGKLLQKARMNALLNKFESEKNAKSNKKN